MSEKTLDLWLELGCEELPPACVRAARRDLPKTAALAFKEARLKPAALHCFATPRRLAVVALGLPARQEAEVKKVIGPARDRALDADGKWTPAALGFLKKYNLAEKDARIEATAKGEYLVAEVAAPRQETSAVLASVVPNIFVRLTFPKTMRWPQGKVPFPRPIRWLGCVLAGEAVAAEYGGLAAGADSWGHRTQSPGAHDMRPAFGADGALDLDDLKSFYLRELGVVVDAEDRRATVVGALKAAGIPPDYFEKKGDDEAREMLALVLDTVEMPALVTGEFDARHLTLPEEVTAAALLGYLHLFPMREADGHLAPRFFAVHNAREEAQANVRAGLERVLAARLADASFFWEADRKLPLAEMARALEGVVFAEGAGTLGDKAARLEVLCRRISAAIKHSPAEADHLARAAALCKADLTSQMVREKEFTHLQGTMGRLYAQAQGEPAEVAAAIGEHYQPAGAEDALPASKLGRVLALADRLDTLAVMFAAGFRPTGAKDPFALRRAAVGVCRLLLEDADGVFAGLPLEEFVAMAAKAAASPAEGESTVVAFILGRLEQIFLDRGFRDDMVAAVAFPAPEHAAPRTSPGDLAARLEALRRFHGDRAAFGKLAIAFKRPINIIRQATEKKVAPKAKKDVNVALFAEPEEKALYDEFERVKEGVAAAINQQRYDDALARLAELRPAVDTYFDTVMVMAEDAKLRANRLAFMRRLAELFLLFADFTRLRGEEEYA